MSPNEDEETIKRYATLFVREISKLAPEMPPEMLPDVILAVAATVTRVNGGTAVAWNKATTEAWLFASNQLGLDTGFEKENPISVSFHVPPGFLGEESAAMVQHERLCVQCGGPLKESLQTPLSVTLTCFKEGCGAKYKDRRVGGVERL